MQPNHHYKPLVKPLQPDPGCPFSPYVMFKPIGYLSCWVPLSTMNWDFSIRCVVSGQTVTTQSPSEHLPDAGVGTYTHPEWKKLVHKNTNIKLRLHNMFSTRKSRLLCKKCALLVVLAAAVFNGLASDVTNHRRSVFGTLQIDVWFECTHPNWDGLVLCAAVTNKGTQPHLYRPLGYSKPFYVRVIDKNGADVPLTDEGLDIILVDPPKVQNAVGDGYINAGESVILRIPFSICFDTHDFAQARVIANWNPENTTNPAMQSLKVEIVLPDDPVIIPAQDPRLVVSKPFWLNTDEVPGDGASQEMRRLIGTSHRDAGSSGESDSRRKRSLAWIAVLASFTGIVYLVVRIIKPNDGR